LVTAEPPFAQESAVCTKQNLGRE